MGEMIHVELGNGRSIKVEWHHKPLERVSICTGLIITKEGTVGNAYSSMSKCHPCDRWSKEEARKITLMRLLKQLEAKDKDDKEGLQKVDRTLIWCAYFSRLAAAKKDA
jgi:hypothetical protein